jgi:hypothetical protein
MSVCGEEGGGNGGRRRRNLRWEVRRWGKSWMKRCSSNFSNFFMFSYWQSFIQFLALSLHPHHKREGLCVGEKENCMETEIETGADGERQRWRK